MSDIIAKGFDGAHLKVIRANRHINEFKAMVDALSGLPANSFSIREQSDGRRTVEFASLGGRGQQLALVIGDAIHNMRAAYDHVWLALHRTLSDDGKPSFPFHEKRENLEDAVRKSPVKSAYPDVEDLVLNHVKPHRDRGGNDLIWSITHFDNIDKHNLIIPTVNVHHINLTIKTEDSRTIHFTDCTIEDAPAFISSKDPLKYDEQANISLDVAFPDDSLFGGQSVFPTLVNMVQATHQTVQLFRNTFL